MISLTFACAMALVALGMVLTPGPNMMYLVSRSISQGRRAGLVSLAGTGVGFLVYMTMANVGLAAVFIVVPWLYTALKVAGAAYLLWLAYRALRPGGVSVFDTRDLPRDSTAKLFRMGLVTNLLNPKAAIMYLALIPQFVDQNAGGVVSQGFQLGALQIAVSLAVNAVIILAAGSIAVFLRRKPSWMRWQRWATGALIGAVGVKLALDAPTPAATA
ncbi:threonine/homoserine/homoserine lactone efflux protein [Curtobacterium sp. PhB142]|uniref:LysE family translocator n=1 Tax=unclassified Curtobacterium TaxID=257496 RepID=UPI0010520F89|nr:MULTISPECIES: LysE family translocator [unclassified Curtobacterium]TCL87835.1 threonine/homoserine/homoserine lactone efflux protein [Curtobacterium sp. PhB142]TCM04816.1 threonine/homoserine/homoserine lactone efflux protein [Curtobacterium sp. PhB134]